jgi:hypothetical protein
VNSASRLPLFALVPALVAGVLLLPPPPASAQCFGPDQLDFGTCCQSVVPNLPAFPSAALGGLNVCWNQCSVSSQNVLKVAWNTPNQPRCSEYVTQLTVSDGTSGLPLLIGTMVLNYTRTWDEITTNGTLQQVWRFTAKADLSAAAGANPTACPLPNCIAPAGPYPTAFYYGYVDYTACAVGGGWEQVLVLYHACDRFIHQPVLSDRPGVFHPARSFAIVAPHNPLQLFVPANNIAAGGPLIGEATRDTGPATPPAVCITEDHVVGGSMSLLGAGCVCTMAQNPKQQSLRQFTGTNQCANTTGVAGGWATLSINFPVLPWFHMVSTSIGAWLNPNVYPSTEQCWVDEGLFVRQSACTGDFIDMKYGGSTRGGWTPILPIPVVVSNFTDVADHYTAPLLGPYPTPILGSLRPTDHLIYVNEP